MNKVAHSEPGKHRLGYGPLSALFVTFAAYSGSQIFVGVWTALFVILANRDSAQAEMWLESSVFAEFLTILILEAVFIYIIWFFLQFMKVRLSEIGLVKPVWKDISYALAGYAVYFLAFVAITYIAQQFVPVLDVEQEQEIGFSKGTTGAALGLVFVSLVILPPIAEEIVMRGFLYTGLRSKLSFAGAAFVTSVIFAAAHLQFGNGAPLLWVAALDTFVLSFILVYLRERTGSLWSPILVHMIKNGLAFSVLFIFKSV